MKVIENFLPDELFEKIQTLMMGSKFDWHYAPGVATHDDTDDFYFTHNFYEHEKQQSKHFELITHPIIGRVSFNFMIRVRANCYVRKYEQYQNGFHTDQSFPHTVGLFSINTNNGYTLFEDGTKHESKANTMILFPGDMKHASVSQTDEKIRVNINFNFV
tara:strand:- start:1460 stop:1939 length:480 start_codon:yes stop_codon:yes gene_type:complete